MLAVLLSYANKAVSLDRLVDALWGDQVPPRADGVVHAYISNLRRALEPHRPARTPSQVLPTCARGYRLVVRAEDLDATRFELLAAEGHRLLAAGRPYAAREALTEALALWRGPALDEFADYDFARAEASRLGQLRQIAVEERLEAQLAVGDHAQAVVELEVLVGEHPLREQLWGLLMVALYRSGRQCDALRAFAQVRRLLNEELGVDPAPVLRRLEADILAQAPSLNWQPPNEDPGPALTVERSLPRADEAALVGREAPLAALVGAVEGAGAGRGQLVLLSGEPGIGKTRLLQELAVRAGARGALVASGRGYEGEGVPAFWPWVQVIDSLVAQLEPQRAAAALGEGAGVVAQIAPRVRAVVGDLGPPPPLDPASARFRLCQAVTGFLTRVAGAQPVVVVLDDLHWADPASLELTRFIAAQLGDTPLVVAVSRRLEDAPPGDPLSSTLGELARIPALTRVALEGLSEPECASLAAQVTGVHPSPAVSAAIHEQTGGNPFFVVELARLLAAEGVLATGGEDGVGVPPGVRDVIRRHLARLPEVTNELLSTAAVVGRQFDLTVVARAVDVASAAALRMIEPAVAIGIVAEDEKSLDGYHFSHAIVHQTIYTELGRPSRAELHARVAQALEATSGDAQARAVEVAHHWFQAAPVAGAERGIAAALTAAATAQDRLAFEQAEQLLRRALVLLDRLPVGPERSRKELSVMNRLATVLTVARGYASPEVADAWRRAGELSRTAGVQAASDLVPLLWGSFTMPLVRLELKAATEVAGQLTELAGTTDEPAVRLAGLLSSALARFHRGRLVAARQELEEARAVCDALDDGAGAALAESFTMSPAVLSRGYLSLAYMLLGDPLNARQTSAEAVVIARRRHQRQYSLTAALNFNTWLHVVAGDAPSVRRRIREIDANDAGVRESATLTTVLSAWALGPEDEARIHEARQALIGLLGSGFKLFGTLHLGFLVDAYLRAGHPEAAIATADQALAQVEATGERFYEAELCRLRGEALLDACPGSRREAGHWLRRARAVAGSQQAVSLQQRAECSLVRVRSRERMSERTERSRA